MGGDGGSIPGRQDLVRMKKKKEVLDKNEELAATWRHCALSHNLLRPPMVACEKGKLFNKEAVLEFLLDRGDNEAGQHIRTLKDVKPLNLTPNPAFKDYGKEALIGGEAVDYGNAMFICPVIGLEMNGRWRFVFYWNCGCVVSEKAYHELKSDKCHKCGLPTSVDDVIVINGNAEDVVKMESKMAARRERAKIEKKSKKKRKLEEAEAALEAVKQAEEEAVREQEKSGLSLAGLPPIKIEKKEEDGIAAALKEFRQSTDGQTEEKKKKSGDTDASKDKGKLSKHGKVKSSAQDKDKLSSSSSSKLSKSSVQDDPTKSDIYKSLFTSHKDAANQPKAHWITMNPGYFR